MKEKTNEEKRDQALHLYDALRALKRVVGEHGEAHLTLLLDDPDIDAFGPYDQETTLGVEHHQNGFVGLLSVGKRERAGIGLTVAGVSVAPMLDIVDGSSHDQK